jgi:hypothetical protein
MSPADPIKSYCTRPLAGACRTEGAPGIERVHTALVAPTLTIGPQARWYFNRAATPAMALVIEIMPSVDLETGG